MNRKQLALTVILALLAGFLGGRLSGQVFHPKPIQDEATTQPTAEEKTEETMKTVEAHEFRLIDKDGKTLASLSQRHHFESLSDVFAEDSKPTRVVPILIMHGKDANAVLTPYKLSMMDGEDVEAILSPHRLSVSDGKDTEAVLGPYTLSMSDIRGSAYLGQTSLELYDKENNLRGVFGSARLKGIATRNIQDQPQSSLVLFGKGGKVVWSAPYKQRKKEDMKKSDPAIF